MTESWDEKAEKWLWDSCGYAPDTSVKELSGWMEMAEKWNWLLRKDPLLSFDLDKMIKADETPVLISDKGYQDFVDRAQKLEAIKEVVSESDKKSMEFLHNMSQITRIQEILGGSEFNKKGEE